MASKSAGDTPIHNTLTHPSTQTHLPCHQQIHDMHRWWSACVPSVYLWCRGSTQSFRAAEPRKRAKFGFFCCFFSVVFFFFLSSFWAAGQSRCQVRGQIKSFSLEEITRERKQQLIKIFNIFILTVAKPNKLVHLNLHPLTIICIFGHLHPTVKQSTLKFLACKSTQISLTLSSLMNGDLQPQFSLFGNKMTKSCANIIQDLRTVFS